MVSVHTIIPRAILWLLIILISRIQLLFKTKQRLQRRNKAESLLFSFSFFKRLPFLIKMAGVGSGGLIRSIYASVLIRPSSRVIADSLIPYNIPINKSRLLL